MTAYIPLDPSAQRPPLPSFVTPSPSPVSHLNRTMQAIMRAKRIVVICGAGISVQAGIPDFRSQGGLFKTLKRDNPRELMSSGKDLFDASVFSAEHSTSLFCQMIAQLSDLSQAAQPTCFHQLLRILDDRGRLLRVYTQNIDAIEQKSGLSFGVPEFDPKRPKTRKPKQVPPLPPVVTPRNDHVAIDPLNNSSQQQQPEASTSRLPSPPVETPRCIPLHGTLQQMHCQICNRSFPLLDHIPALISGQPPGCPECTSVEKERQLLGKRPRGIGRLRPSVVLYNEAHKDGEGVGNVVQKDLIGSSKGKGRSGADLLLVVGTSLRVPGTKRMVREFSKAVRSRGSTIKDDAITGLASPTPSPRRSPVSDEEALPKSIYLNLDFPVPTREWDGVFDAWIHGDAQEFAQMLHGELEKEARAKESAVEKKKRKEEDSLAEQQQQQRPYPETPTKPTKRKSGDDTLSPGKRRKPTSHLQPLSPPETPTSHPQHTAQNECGYGPPKLTIRIGPGLKPQIVITRFPSRLQSAPSSESSPPSSLTDEETEVPNPYTLPQLDTLPKSRPSFLHVQPPVSFERTTCE